MTTFADLWRSHFDLSPGEQQARVRMQFPAVAAGSALRLWTPQDSVPLAGKRLLIGTAPYSIADMKLLDLVASAHRTIELLQVDVFDVSCCQTPEDFERYVPGIGPVLQTPVAGLWSDGKLIEKGTGHQARQLVARECRLNPADLEQLWDPAFPQ